MPDRSAPVCGLCFAPARQDALVQYATGGSLLSVCRRCFYLKQIGELSASLEAQDPAVLAVEDGLRTLYEVVKNRVEEVCLQEFQNAASPGQGQGEGRSSSEGR